MMNIRINLPCRKVGSKYYSSFKFEWATTQGGGDIVTVALNTDGDAIVTRQLSGIGVKTHFSDDVMELSELPCIKKGNCISIGLNKPIVVPDKGYLVKLGEIGRKFVYVPEEYVTMLSVGRD